jgi:hypothetical protein
MKLFEAAKYLDLRINSKKIVLDKYVTTDSRLPNFPVEKEN